MHRKDNVVSNSHWMGNIVDNHRLENSLSSSINLKWIILNKLILSYMKTIRTCSHVTLLYWYRCSVCSFSDRNTHYTVKQWNCNKDNSRGIAWKVVSIEEWKQKKTHIHMEKYKFIRVCINHWTFSPWSPLHLRNSQSNEIHNSTEWYAEKDSNRIWWNRTV